MFSERIDRVSKIENGDNHWRSSHYAVTHVRNKKVTVKGGHLMW